MKKHKKYGISVLIMLCFVLTACGSGGGKSDYSMSGAVTESADMDAGAPAALYANGESGEYEYEDRQALEEEEADTGSGEGRPVSVNKKLIRNVNLDVETYEFDALTAYITGRVEQLGGYVESMDVEGIGHKSKTTRHGSMTVRIPSDRLDGFLESVGEQSNITYRSENVQDVTSQYVDLESHKKALLAEQQRLLEILEKAGTVTDIIEIEQRLSQVRYEIENMEAQLRVIDNKVAYSTVRVSIREVEAYTPVEERSTGERISAGFSESVKNVLHDYREFFIGFVIRIPYLIVPVGVLLLVLVITLAAIKVSNKKRERLAVRRQMQAVDQITGQPMHSQQNQQGQNQQGRQDQEREDSL